MILLYPQGILLDDFLPFNYAEVTSLAVRSRSFPQGILAAGGCPEGAEIPALYLFSPLWAFFGYFLSQQKVTTSRPQTRLEQQTAIV